MWLQLIFLVEMYEYIMEYFGFLVKNRKEEVLKVKLISIIGLLSQLELFFLSRNKSILIVKVSFRITKNTCFSGEANSGFEPYVLSSQVRSRYISISCFPEDLCRAAWYHSQLGHSCGHIWQGNIDKQLKIAFINYVHNVLWYIFQFMINR